MFNFFKRRQKTIPLIFKNGQAAFEYACSYMRCDVREGSPLPALVLDGKVEFGLADKFQIGADRSIQCVLRVPSTDGGFTVIAITSRPPKMEFAVGDLVVWLPGQHLKEVGEKAGDSRFGWVGLIIGTLEPEWHDGQWKIRERF